MSNRRQTIYDRIRASSKDEVVLEEMIRLGFWPAEGTLPIDAADDVREQAAIERELAALRTEQTRLSNIEALKKELLKRRLAASKANRAENKARRERERTARAEAWKAVKATDITFLGRGVSGGLSDKTCDEARLVRQGLPVLRTADDVARAASVSIPELRFLSYARTTSTVSHYQRFQIPKKRGGTRLISAPMPRLKKLQRWMLDAILSKVEVHDAAHGFREDRSIVTNAQPHVGARVVVNLDLENFFPTVAFPRIRGMFRSLGYGDFVATVLALIASEPDTYTVELDGRRYQVAQGPRKLPQGAPTSPAVTNVLCRRLDRRLFHAAKALGFCYSRYADDLTFSTADETAAARSGQLLKQVRFIVAQEGFVPHPEKTRILRPGRQQEVTGIVVNDKLAVDRATLRRFRALLHEIDKGGPAGRSWGESPDVFASAKGFASYVAMVDPEKGRTLLAKVDELAKKYGYRAPARPRAKSLTKDTTAGVTPPPIHTAESSASKDAPSPAAPVAGPTTPAEPPKKKKWWKLF